MYKLDTQLAFFKFDTSLHHGPINVTWFKLVQGDDLEEIGKCFNSDELNQFQQFVANNLINFPGSKNYHICNSDETPYCGMMSIIPSNRRAFPSNIIIRKNPQLSRQGHILSCMDIILSNYSSLNCHNYNLDFDVIGRINL